MSRPDNAFIAVILAAQRPGPPDALAAEVGVPNKALVPLLGAPLIRHVVEALAATPGLTRLRIVVEASAIRLIQAEMPALAVPVEFVVAADNLADSVYAAARGVDQSMVVTTADNVLLTPDAVGAMVRTLQDGADVAVAVATRASVLAAHPDGQRRFYSLADDAYSNCNLYAFSGPRAIAAAESFRGGGQFAKKPLRLLSAVGPLTVAMLFMCRLSLHGAMARLSRRFGLRIEPVVLADGAQAIDVDNPRTFGVAETLLRARRDRPPARVPDSLPGARSHRPEAGRLVDVA